MSKRNENMKVSNMKSGLGGILMRMRHSDFISNKQVNKSSGRRLWAVSACLPRKNLKPSQKSCRTKSQGGV